MSVPLNDPLDDQFNPLGQMVVPEVTLRIVQPPPLVEGHALGDLLRDHRCWQSSAARIPPVVTAYLWFVMLWDAALTAWLGEVWRGSLGCSGWVCQVVTLGGHPQLTLSLAAGSVAWLIATCAPTRGFTTGTAAFLVAMTASALMATLAAVGSMLIVLAAVAVLAVLISFVVLMAG